METKRGWTPEAFYAAYLTAFYDADLDRLIFLCDLAYRFPVLAPAFRRAMRDCNTIDTPRGRPS
jgi:hypothetical protein